MMPQPLFLEVTDAVSKQTRIVGLAHVTDILHDEGGAMIVKAGERFATAESYDDIKQALGIIGGQQL